MRNTAGTIQLKSKFILNSELFFKEEYKSVTDKKSELQVNRRLLPNLGKQIKGQKIVRKGGNKEREEINAKNKKKIKIK